MDTTDKNQECHEDIQEHCSLRRGRQVLLPDGVDDVGDGGVGREGLGAGGEGFGPGGSRRGGGGAFHRHGGVGGVYVSRARSGLMALLGVADEATVYNTVHCGRGIGSGFRSRDL